MKLLQGTFLFFSMCSLCYSQEKQDSTTPTAKTKQNPSTNVTTSSPTSEKIETVQPSVKSQEKPETTVPTLSAGSSVPSSSLSSIKNGKIKEPSSTLLSSTETPSSNTTETKTVKGATKNENQSKVPSTANPQSSDYQFQSTLPTTQSSPKSNYVLTTSTKKQENALETSSTPYIKDQGSIKDSDNTSSLVNSNSYSSVILPVVIALIAITLSVFTLVGLYRMCWKTDPGTPDSGTDQPQSDKESVKLLTVKTISPETSEQSAQGKNKN
ncbi:endomucin [Macrotis lagotis]|uniref:endomucin n=1 Tax=Macrotis lagotis TaxID=92651 RepID=UPI003D69B639